MRHQNRLASEKSPYLLQHAGNPVDWYPWGDEAFELAAAEDKPIFLSIGYSTCHWCHVMERETFEDEEAAQELNETFVCVKVDREERPDIDALYMTACQMMTGSGGWPLNVFLTPDKRPFFAGSYFPRNTRGGRVGIVELCQSIRELWQNRRDEAEDVASRVLTSLSMLDENPAGPPLGDAALFKGVRELEQSFDTRFGGFGTAPKFPTPHSLLFLMRHHKRTGSRKCLHMSVQTLEAISLGGIRDHVGFGFHRYSTDEKWLLPHFEKMLYDQALLTMAYLEAYRLTGRSDFKSVAEETIRYVLRDLRSPEGAFYCGEDADSEGVEGKFYVWKERAIDALLGEETTLFKKAYGILPAGNFRDEATRRHTGQNIPHLVKPLDRLAGEVGLPLNELSRKLEAQRERLFLSREKRIRPHRDDKVLTDWNGLMIAALSLAGRALDAEYAEHARKAADFLLETMYRNERLLHRWREGEAAVEATVTDYAFFIWGLTELFEATFAPRYLRIACDLARVMLDTFLDPDTGGLYNTGPDAGGLPVRQKEAFDGALPSGNSTAMLALFRLAAITGDPWFHEKAENIGRAFSAQVNHRPAGFTHMLCAVESALTPVPVVVICGEPDSPDTKKLLETARSAGSPDSVLLFRQPGAEELAELIPFIRSQTMLEGKPTAYVCRNYTCKEPTNSPARLKELLANE